MNIGEKLFTYIGNHNDLTQSMVDQYRNSLIFLGDEQQIFQPLTGTYIGISKSEWDQKIQELGDQSAALNSLDSHIHKNVVNSIWVATNEEHFDAKFYDNSVPHTKIAGQIGSSNGLGAGDAHYLMTNQDLVIRGLFDTNGNSALSTDEFGYRYDDSFDETTGTYTYNNILWGHINRSKAGNGNFKGSSGIQVNVHHTGSYKTGTYQGLEYSYWEGHDYLTIDDSYTWAYITNQSSYIMEYSKRVAIAQANRVYHDILGDYDTVYIEKSFNEAFTFNDDGELVPIVKNVDGQDTLEDVFVHLKDGTWQKVNIYNDSDYYYIYARYDDGVSVNPIYYILKTNSSSTASIPGVDDGIGGTITLTYLSDKTSILDPIDGWDKTNMGAFQEVTWYHIDADATAQGKTNLADGIQTFKEVTYILDQITDGSDAGITLTYNIAQNAIDINELKDWKNQIGEHVVTDFYATTPEQSFVHVNTYSINKWATGDQPAIGETRLDIDVLTAQTYTLGGSTYAAYLTSHANQMQPVWMNMGDTTDEDYYYDLSTMSPEQKTQLAANLTEVFGASNTVPKYQKVADQDYERTGNDINISDVSTATSGIILFNYKKAEYPIISDRGIINALTTVDWVTTYVGWGLSDALSQMNVGTEDVKTYFMTYINDNLTITYTDQPKQFVSFVSQNNGKIDVHYKTLPLDQILASEEVFGNDFFMEITVDEALALTNDGLSVTGAGVYIKFGNDYTEATSIQDGIQYYIVATTNRFTPIDVSSITDSNDASELTALSYALIENGGNYTYFQKINTNTIDGNAIHQYSPVDINELLTDNNLTYLSKNILDSLYYYAGTTSSKKYIDVSYYQSQTDGHTIMHVTTYVTPIGAATSTNTGLADAYDVRHTIETMFSWVDLKTGHFLN